jgi:hypothetical protein
MLKQLEVVSAALILASASAAARDPGVPTIDIQKGCRAAEAELTSLFGSQSDAYKSCLDDEQTARDQLVKDWAAFSAPVKATCVRPTDYLPSYVEWQACLELTKEVLRMRKAAPETVGENTGGKSTKGRTGSKAKQCPVVEIGVDGNIISVDAC